MVGKKKGMKRAIRLSVYVALLAVFLGNRTAIAKGGERYDPFAPFHPGSWITVQEVEVYLGGTTTTTVLRKITAKKDGLTEVWDFTEDGSRKLKKERDFLEGHTPKTLFMKQQSTQTATLKIGPGRYKTTKISYVPDGKFSLARGPLTVYLTDDLKVPYREMLLSGDDIALPENVVRAEYVALNRNTGKMVRYESQIVDFYWLVPVADEKVPCFLEETKVIEIASSEQVAVVKRWLSDKIPGHVVKLESRFQSPYGPGKLSRWVKKYHLVAFRPQAFTVEGARVSFEVPDDFRSLTARELSSRFPLRQKSTRVFAAKEGIASITVQVSEPSMLIHEVEDLRIYMEKNLSRSAQSLRPFDQGFTEIHDRKFIYQKFISNLAGADFYTYNLSTLHGGKIVSLDFTMSRELFSEYEQLRRLWVDTIQIK